MKNDIILDFKFFAKHIYTVIIALDKGFYISETPSNYQLR